MNQFDELYESIVNEGKNPEAADYVAKFYIKDQGLKKGETISWEDMQGWLTYYAQEHDLPEDWDVDRAEMENLFAKKGITLEEDEEVDENMAMRMSMMKKKKKK